MCIDVTHMTDMRIVKQIIFINYDPLILIVIVILAGVKLAYNDRPN